MIVLLAVLAATGAPISKLAGAAAYPAERTKQKFGRTISARHGPVNWKMGKLTKDQAVGGEAFNRR